MDEDTIRITTATENTALKEVYSTDTIIELEIPNFFTYFKELTSINIESLTSGDVPTFFNLTRLESITVALKGLETHVLDEKIVRGLTNLRYLDFSGSYFHGIANGAFKGLNQLSELSLSNCGLEYIENGVLQDIPNVEIISLVRNKLSNVSDDIFEGLNVLTIIYISINPEFPLNALMSAKYLESVYISKNGFQTLDPFVFQQLNSLTYINLNDAFICDCRLQWTSLLTQYGKSISGVTCSEPPSLQGTPVSSEENYVNCSQTQVYQCFNLS